MKALEGAWLEGCFNSSCFFEGLVGSWWDEQTQLLLISAWVLSPAQVRVAWQVADPLNYKYELPYK